MRVAVIGTETPLGALIAETCRERGHAVSGFPQGGPLPAAPEEYDVVVDAALPEGDGSAHAALLETLAAAVRGLPSVRLIAVGSAGSLFWDDRRTLRVRDVLPEAARGAAAAEAAEAALRRCGDNWTCFTPPPVFSAEGRGNGRPILGRDIRLLNSAGESRLTYADCAAAIADEIEAGAFRAKRFTAVSDVSAAPLTPENNLIDLRKKYMFTRRGAYFGIASDLLTRGADLAYQSARLCISTRRGTSTGVPEQGKDLVFLAPVYRGQPAAFSVRTTPTELILTTAFGEVRACMADSHLLLIRGENGLGLQLSGAMRPGELMKPRGARAWEGVFRWRCSLVFNPLAGSLRMDAPWDGERQTTPRFCGVVAPEADGRFLLAVDESVCAGALRAQYPSYDDALADVTADWEGFLSRIPRFDPALENARIEAAWNLWAFLLEPSGFVRRPHIMMAASSVASSWQMSHNAAALRDNLPLAMDLMTNMLDSASPVGQLPDFVDDGREMAQGIHPPTQGWALRWIMRKHDLGSEVPRETLERMYDGYRKWADWFFLARDIDGDGLPQYDNGDESGFDDCSPFEFHTALETPDLAAYLVTLYDALADLAQILGRGAAAADHRRRADALTEKLLDAFWTGERFVARDSVTHAVVAGESLLFYMPFVLGRRLPQDVIDRMTADLLVEGDYLTPSGLAFEKLGSDFFRCAGMARGWVLPPSNLLLLTGMYDAGKTEEAKMIARRYCDACARWGMSMLLDPVRGSPNGFACSWPACAFLVLADMACNM